MFTLFVDWHPSFGIANLLKSDNRFEDILLRADKALYEAKNSGRNRIISDS